MPYSKVYAVGTRSLHFQKHFAFSSSKVEIEKWFVSLFGAANRDPTATDYLMIQTRRCIWSSYWTRYYRKTVFHFRIRYLLNHCSVSLLRCVHFYLYYAKQQFHFNFIKYKFITLLPFPVILNVLSTILIRVAER